MLVTKTNNICRTLGIPRRFMRHANVGIALACCICLNKIACSNQDTVNSG
jgi:hypothetical protein